MYRCIYGVYSVLDLTQPLQLCFYISQVLEHACPLAEIPGIESPEFERPREAKRGPGEVLKNHGELAFLGCLFLLEVLRCKEKLILLLNAAGVLLSNSNLWLR